MILVVFSVAAVYVGLQYFFIDLIESGIEKNLNHDHIYFNVIYSQQVYFSNFLLLIGVVLTIGTLVWGLYFSHRIAGPLYKLDKYFGDAKNSPGKKLAPLSFRKDDFFQEVSTSINDYLEANNLLEKSNDS